MYVDTKYVKFIQIISIRIHFARTAALGGLIFSSIFIRRSHELQDSMCIKFAYMFASTPT